jgi:hypothetical protein
MTTMRETRCVTAGRRISCPGPRDIAYREEVWNGKARPPAHLADLSRTLLETPERSAKPQPVNDALSRSWTSAAIHRLAILPLNHPARCQRVERAQVWALGCMVFGNVNGVPLADERFWPLTSEPATPAHLLHPSHLPGRGGDAEYRRCRGLSSTPRSPRPTGFSAGS